MIIKIIRIIVTPDAERVFGEAKTDAALDAVGEIPAVQLVERLGGHGYIVELDETHWPVSFVAET